MGKTRNDQENLWLSGTSKKLDFSKSASKFTPTIISLKNPYFYPYNDKKEHFQIKKSVD